MPKLYVMLHTFQQIMNVLFQLFKLHPVIKIVGKVCKTTRRHGETQKVAVSVTTVMSESFLLTTPCENSNVLWFRWLDSPFHFFLCLFELSIIPRWF